jgi:hypothetical protein
LWPVVIPPPDSKPLLWWSSAREAAECAQLFQQDGDLAFQSGNVEGVLGALSIELRLQPIEDVKSA